MKKDDPPDYLRDAFRDELIDGLIELGGEYPVRFHEEISRFRFYLETLEEFISNQEKSEIKQLEKHAQNLSKDQQSPFWAWHYPIHWDNIFRYRLRSTFLVTLWSFTETQIERTCRYVTDIVRPEIKCSELTGNLLKRSKKFLKAFGEFTRPSKEEWALISRIYDVRNVLVHYDGDLSRYKNAERLSQFLNQQLGLSQTQDFIPLDKNLCLFCLDKIESFLEHLRNEVKNLCERVKRFQSK